MMRGAGEEVPQAIALQALSACTPKRPLPDRPALAARLVEGEPRPSFALERARFIINFRQHKRRRGRWERFELFAISISITSTH